MMAVARFEERHAFVLSKRDAGRIWRVLEENVGPVVAEASCTDGIQRSFAALDELTDYENPRLRAIESLTFTARDDTYTQRATVTVGARYASSIGGSVEGPEETVVHVKNSLGEIFDGIKPWYSPVSRIDFFYLLLGVLFFFFTVLNLMVGGESGESQSLEPARAVFITTLILAGFAGVGGLIWLLNSVRARFFPVTVFSIGQGQGRYELDDKVRWVVIVGIFVSVVASLFVAALIG